MNKIITIIFLLSILTFQASSQNQLSWQASYFRPSQTESLFISDSVYNYYNANNKTRASQITAIWSPISLELLVEPNVNLDVLVRTKSDSAVQFRKVANTTDSLKIIWANSSWYNEDYTLLIKQHTYGFYNGIISFTESKYYYGNLIDSVVYATGAAGSTNLTKSLVRYFYKNSFNSIDSIVDIYVSSQPPIKWNFKYNSQNNLVEWKYINLVYPAGNKLYKMFYNGSSNLIDSIQFFANALYHSKTYVYEYNANGKWVKSSSLQMGMQGRYPNNISDYKIAKWGNKSYFDSIEYYYYNSTISNYSKSLGYNTFNDNGNILSINQTVPQWDNKIGSQIIYNYNKGISNSLFENKATANKLDLYPNPSQSIFNLKINEPFKQAEIIIINSIGEKIQGYQLTEEQTKIDLSQMSKGIYIIRLVLDGKLYNHKLLLN